MVKEVDERNPRDSVGGGVKPQMSLTGEPIDKSSFKHNNMVPFYSGKSNGATVSADICRSQTRSDARRWIASI